MLAAEGPPPPGRRPRCSWPGRSARRGRALPERRRAGPDPGERGLEALWTRRPRDEPLQYIVGEVASRARARARAGRLHPATRDRAAGRARAGPRRAGRRRGARAGHRQRGDGMRPRQRVARRTVPAVERAEPSGRIRRENVRRLGLDGRDRVREGHLFGPPEGAVPAAPSTPWSRTRPTSPRPARRALPVEVRDYEPREALDGGPAGWRSSTAGRPAREWSRPGAGCSRRWARPGRGVRGPVTTDPRYQDGGRVHRDLRRCDRMLVARRR